MTGVDVDCYDTWRHDRAIEDQAVDAVRRHVLGRLAELKRKTLPCKLRAAQVAELEAVLVVVDGPHGDPVEGP